VGEALASGTLLHVTTNEVGVIANAVQVFNEIITSKILTLEATKRDKGAGVNMENVPMFGSLLLYLFGNEYSDTTEDDAATAAEEFKNLSVEDRLQEVINIAKMNLAMMYIVENDWKSMRLGEALLNDVMHFYKDCECAEVINEKLETLRDFMSAFGLECVDYIAASPHSLNTLPGMMSCVLCVVYIMHHA
jgi:hypothetical protein